MNTHGKEFGRILFALAAIAMLAGVTARSAGAQDGQTITSRAAQDTWLCLDEGGEPRAIGSTIYCVFPGGHGWACEEAETLHDCHEFLTTSVGSVKGGVVQSETVSLAVGQSSSGIAAANPKTAQIAKSASANVESASNP